MISHTEHDAIAKLRRRFEQLSELPEHEWAWFKRTLTVLHLDAGDAFLEVGDPCFPVAFVAEGLIKTSYFTADGAEVIRNFSGADDFLAAIVPLLNGQHVSDVTIRCLETTRLVVGDYRTFVEAYSRAPNWERLGRRLAEHNYLQREKRQRELLIDGIETRVARFYEENRRLIGRLKQRDIASYLGIEPETLSRVRGRMRAKRRKS